MAVWKSASRAGHPFLTSDDLDADEPLVRDTYIPMAQITVADDGSRICGFIAMVGDFIGALFVAPDLHRSGIGRLLVEFEAGRRGPIGVEVYEANAKARSFYGAAGFVETGRRKTDDRDRPLPLVQMTLSRELGEG